METDINMIINLLEAEKAALLAKKAKNETEINKCDLLIEYYMNLRFNLFTQINEKRNSLNGYKTILSLFESIPESILYKFNKFITENKFIEKSLDTEEEIESLSEKDKEIKDNIINAKKRKRKLIEKNINIEKKITFIDEKLQTPTNLIDEHSINKKLSHKNSKKKK